MFYRTRIWLLLAGSLLALSGCGWLGGTPEQEQAANTASETAMDSAAQSAPQAAQSPAAQASAAQGAQQQASSEPVIVALGDSLTAGFGLPQEESYPSLLQEKLRAAGYPHRVVNAGVSGDTSAGALARMDWIFRQRVDMVIVCLGGNDGLRGLSTDALADNLRGIITKAQAQGARVLLAGMQMPSNYGADYQAAFSQVFPAVAQETGVDFLPFLLEGVAGDPALNQTDRIHPNTEGARIVTETVWQALQPLLKQGS